MKINALVSVTLILFFTNTSYGNNYEHSNSSRHMNNPTAPDQANAHEKKSVEVLIDEYLRDRDYDKITPLCEIMCVSGSDKGNRGIHNYTTLYSKLFSQMKHENLNVFELGLGTNNTDVPSNMGAHGIPGASLRGWVTYFPNAKVYGADIDKRILFQERNIQTFYCDQRDQHCINEMFSNSVLKDIKFDIIIDDGLHEFEANRIFLINSIDKLKKGGIYIIEDLTPTTISAFKKIVPDLKTKYSLSYIDILTIPSRNSHDNFLLIIQK